MEIKFGYIYVVHDTKTNFRYIGQSKRVDQTNIDNYYGIFGNNQSNFHDITLIKDIIEININNQTQLNEFERFHIDKYRKLYGIDNILNRANGSLGSNGVLIQSEDSNKLRSIASSGENNPCYGRTGDKNPMFGITGDQHPSFGIPSKQARAVSIYGITFLNKFHAHMILQEKCNMKYRLKSDNLKYSMYLFLN